MSTKTITSCPISPLYSRYLSSSERKSLRKVPVGDTSSEINLLRLLNSLFMEFQQSAPQDLSARMSALHTCVVINVQLVRLVRLQLLQPPGEDAIQELLDAILLANERDGFFSPLESGYYSHA